jgi:hypothetical protein
LKERGAKGLRSRLKHLARKSVGGIGCSKRANARHGLKKEQTADLEASTMLISKLSHFAHACAVQQPGKQFLMSPILQREFDT